LLTFQRRLLGRILRKQLAKAKDAVRARLGICQQTTEKEGRVDDFDVFVQRQLGGKVDGPLRLICVALKHLFLLDPIYCRSRS
jgi:hypothetical protein